MPAFQCEADVSQLLHGFGMAPDDFQQRVVRGKERPGQPLLRIELVLGAQRARHGDDFLQNSDFPLGGEVGGLAAILRV